MLIIESTDHSVRPHSSLSRNCLSVWRESHLTCENCRSITLVMLLVLLQQCRGVSLLFKYHWLFNSSGIGTLFKGYFTFAHVNESRRQCQVKVHWRVWRRAFDLWKIWSNQPSNSGRVKLSSMCKEWEKHTAKEEERSSRKRRGWMPRRPPVVPSVAPLHPWPVMRKKQFTRKALKLILSQFLRNHESFALLCLLSLSSLVREAGDKEVRYNSSRICVHVCAHQSLFLSFPHKLFDLNWEACKLKQREGERKKKQAEQETRK